MDPDNLVDINAPLTPAEKAASTPEKPVEKAAPTPAPKQEFPDHSHKEHVVPLRTFSSDLARAVRDKKGSIVKIAIAEDERRHRELQDAKITSRKNLTFIILSLIFIVIALGAIFGVRWYTNKQSVVTPIETPLPSSIIPSEAAATLDITDKRPEEIFVTVEQTLGNPEVRKGGIKNILFSVKNPSGSVGRVSASEFLTAIDSHASTSFKQSLSKDFMYGIYLYEVPNSFLVLKGSAHDFLLAGLLEWEDHMLEDLGPLFGIQIAGTGSVNTSTPFTDTLIQNREARAILSEDKTPILYYAFINQEVLLIAKDPKVFAEAVRRFGN